jgi:hypothetical protein
VNWIWLNIPLMVVFFVAVAGIPLWLVLRRPDFAAAPADQRGQPPVTVAAGGDPASCQARPRELVGAAR